MLSKEKLDEIKEHLEKARNPVFFYDNDADGLCSYIILRRVLGRGLGVAVRSYPELDERYADKAEQLKADCVFVLDKPTISDGFVNRIKGLNLPLIWIDHHGIELRNFTREKIKNGEIECYNNSESGEPTTYIVQQIFNREEDKWISLIGCISDHYLPDFASDFGDKYPELWAKNIKEPFDVLYNTEFGKIARAINFGLKDSLTNVVAMQNYLIKCNTPGDVLAESSGNDALRKKYEELSKRCRKFVEEAESTKTDELIFFTYGGESSISSDIANELYHRNKGKYVAVSFMKGNISNVSLRGKNVKKILSNILPKLEHATGGGHEDAVGARIMTGDLERFKEMLLDEISKEKLHA